jgi:hypothetical protein
VPPTMSGEAVRINEPNGVSVTEFSPIRISTIRFPLPPINRKSPWGFLLIASRRLILEVTPNCFIVRDANGQALSYTAPYIRKS